MMLLSWANTAYYQHLMQGIREAIDKGAFEAFRNEPRHAGRPGNKVLTMVRDKPFGESVICC
jgi:queuine/archaeosine tRNA-ribosyltransferase